MCGEKRSHTDANNDTVGSPPRVRGKGKNAYRPERTTGITPACAGKSPFFPGVPGLRWDHPRVCGEKNIPQIHISRSTGSPPRVRGKESFEEHGFVIGGITPACAGKSRATAAQQRAGRDHPRVCGEKLIASKRETLCTGSPPRVRGKAFIAEIRTRAVRITPACAGKRLKRSHSIGHFSCILCLFHSVLHRASVSGGSRAGPCAPPCLPAQNAVPV